MEKIAQKLSQVYFFYFSWFRREAVFCDIHIR
jgi:hypothetical protein